MMDSVTDTRKDPEVARRVGETKVRTLRVPEDQWRRWEEAASAGGQTISDYLRALADKEADKRLGKKR